jgi:hypothetical protein
MYEVHSGDDVTVVTFDYGQVVLYPSGTGVATTFGPTYMNGCGKSTTVVATGRRVDPRVVVPASALVQGF